MTRRCCALAIPSIMIAAAHFELNWSVKAPLPRAQAGGAAALFGQTMAVAGGTAWENGVKLWLRDFQVYDLPADRWRAGPALPEPLAYGAFAQSESALEIFGGAGGSSTVSRKIWRIDSSLARWTQAGETPADLLLSRAVRPGRRVFLFGGCADVADLTRCADAVWMREDEGPWRQVARLPAGPVALAATAVFDGRVYFFGGCSMPAAGKLINRAEAWVFDPGAFAFKRLRDLPSPNRGLSAVAASGHVWLAGGYTASLAEAVGKGPEFGFTPAVWSYDPDADQYRSQAPMPAAMSSIELFHRGGSLWGAGGEDRMRSRSSRTMAAAIQGAR
jgi:N-acetylneuraminic acid mutarotase